MSSSSADISYSAAMQVSTTWDDLKCTTTNFVDTLGEEIRNRLFELSPATALLLDEQQQQVCNKTTSKMVDLVDMMDCVIQLVGPNIDSLDEYLKDFGKRYESEGASPEDIDAIATVVVTAVESMVKFGEQDRDDWAKLFSFVGSKMKEGMVRV